MSHTNNNLFKEFLANIPTRKHIPDSLQLSQKQTNFKIHSLTKINFRLNIFAINFALKPIFFTVHMSFFDTKKITKIIRGDPT